MIVGIQGKMIAAQGESGIAWAAASDYPGGINGHTPSSGD